MTYTELRKILDQIFPLIDEVGNFIRDEQKKVTLDHIVTKAANSLVTYVDQTAENMLVEGLGSILPNASFLTEEGTITNADSDLAWIIDPLDGTTNFLCGVPFFSISVALKYQNEMVIGIVHSIMQKENFYAIAGGGAYHNGVKLEMTQSRELRESILATGFPYSELHRTDEYLNVLKSLLRKVRAVRRLGSAALDLAFVACGRFDGYYEKNLNIWDVAAGALLVKEAGGRVTGFFSEEGWMDGSSIIGARPEIYPGIISSIEEHQPV